ncbi:Dyp-type peroxidase [Agrobacterium sp. NPDC089420]|uniref:Dyp-type peroxidase n=1 Tax=Agrobacterium sp. NPDC089420 TaxID=3363918 RepID=UPI00384D35BA
MPEIHAGEPSLPRRWRDLKQIMLTSAIPFPGDHAGAVDDALAKLVPELRSGGAIRNVLREQGIHFMTITVVRGDAGENTHLVFEINADADADADGDNEAEVIQRVARLLDPWLKPLFETAGIPPLPSIQTLLSRHGIHTHLGLFGVAGIEFRGTPQMSVTRIRSEATFARGVRDYFDAHPIGNEPPLSTLHRVRAYIEAQPALKPLLVADPLPSEKAPEEPWSLPMLIGRAVLAFLWPILLLFAVLLVVAAVTTFYAAGITVGILALLVGILLAALALAAVTLWLYGALRALEKGNEPDDSLPDPSVLAEIIQHENWSAQNHLAGISVMQAGRLRILTLRLAFWIIGQMVAHTYRPGFLGELSTIHFARWVLLPGTNKLLFFSNYGGSWESYLEDFITRASAGLTAAWSNTRGFPRTRNLFMDGATDGDRFKRWARRQQQPTRFWYSAYPGLTTARIRANAKIRHDLISASTQEEAATWLTLLGSRARDDHFLETTDIQALLFGGLSRHPHAACLALNLPDDPERARAWLRTALPHITFGDQPPARQVVVLGLAAGGLTKLGLPAETRAAFPIAYTMGMAHPARTNILSDTGDDKPQDWLWGTQERAVDAALLVYADSQPTLEAAVEALSRDIIAENGRVAHRVTLDPLPERKAGESGINVAREPFGFVDGVSQPIIRGTRRWMRQTDAIHHIEPGEFLLGYPDGRGFFPPSPSIAAAADPGGLLPRMRPIAASDDKDKAAARDFGRNGTFLVIRQLEQDVETFNGFVADAARACEKHPAVPAAITEQAQRQDWIAAKMVGRWKNGTSLVRYPYGPGKTEDDRDHPPDNEFLYGAEDPGGERCPFGSHIRRANPRDSKLPQSADEIAITNRHRILRVGRRFSPAGSGDATATKPGLLFMCLNADIERQFEFIQQTWAMAWQFHGLENEADPLIGRGVEEDGKPRKLARLTIPSPRGPLHLTNIRDFVRVRGGGYFFVPGQRSLHYLSTLEETERG